MAKQAEQAESRQPSLREVLSVAKKQQRERKEGQDDVDGGGEQHSWLHSRFLKGERPTLIDEGGNGPRVRAQAIRNYAQTRVQAMPKREV